MMNKITFVSLLSVLSCGSLAHAGEMGSSDFCCSAFGSLEGGYSSSKITGYDFTINGTNNEISATKTKKSYTVRLGAGMLTMASDNVGFTGEFGWGYYGSTTLSPNISGITDNINVPISDKYTLTGFDALMGVSLIQTYFNLSLKAGALIQNMKVKSSYTNYGYPAINSVVLKNNSTEALPEIKLGAGYNIDSNWSITAAYMIAFGSAVKTSASYDAATTTSTLTISNQNPTINAILFGIQYMA